MPDTKRIAILGSTGSIGTQTIEVVKHLRASGSHHDFEIVGLAAGRLSSALRQQIESLGVRSIATQEHGTIAGLTQPIEHHFTGDEAAEHLVRALHAGDGLDLVVGAIVGSAGIGATLAALELGIDVALANKETLVAAGEIVVREAQRTGARLFPVDSEHSAIWQCISAHGCGAPPVTKPAGVNRMVLTASGGALRGKTAEEIRRAAPSDALNHPNWSMGPKVTIDSASLMNKGLELIEAHWLFDMDADDLSVLIHPTSTVHSFVEFDDASVLAQLGAPDMRAPIQYALTQPDRPKGCAPRLDLVTMGTLEFEEPDPEIYPALALAYDVIRTGGTSGAILNGANEEAVCAFLDPANEDGSRMPFGMITDLVSETMREIESRPIQSLACVREADSAARAFVRERLKTSV